MSRRSKALAAASAAWLAACSPSAERNSAEPANVAAPAQPAPAPASSPAPTAELSIIVRGDGLLVEGAGRAAPLTFGKSTPAEAQAALAALGAPKRSSNAECPPGPLDFLEWDNGLDLAFQDGKLAGWWANDRAVRIATAAGLRPGSSRSALGKAAVEDSTVGKVFTIDEVNGFLTDDGAKVDALWAGAACIFS